jgi:hypothetical protein
MTGEGGGGQKRVSVGEVRGEVGGEVRGSEVRGERAC